MKKCSITSKLTFFCLAVLHPRRKEKFIANSSSTKVWMSASDLLSHSCARCWCSGEGGIIKLATNTCSWYKGGSSAGNLGAGRHCGAGNIGGTLHLSQSSCFFITLERISFRSCHECMAYGLIGAKRCGWPTSWPTGGSLANGVVPNGDVPLTTFIGWIGGGILYTGPPGALVRWARGTWKWSGKSGPLAGLAR